MEGQFSCSLVISETPLASATAQGNTETDSDKVVIKTEDLPEPPKADETPPAPKDEGNNMAVAAMAVAAPEDMPDPTPVVTKAEDTTMQGVEATTDTSKGQVKKEEENPPSAEGPSPGGAAAAESSNTKNEDEKKEEIQSVEAAAAEAGLGVMTTSDGGLVIGAVPPLQPPMQQQKPAAPVPAPATTPAQLPEESPYPYPVNAGKDVISGKGGKVSGNQAIHGQVGVHHHWRENPIYTLNLNTLFSACGTHHHHQVQQYNRHFRNLVAESYPAYDATTSKIAKRRIGVAIYTTVLERGGRFLDAQGKELDRAKGVLKVMKALKVGSDRVLVLAGLSGMCLTLLFLLIQDAKTWTSDAKRAAKERRESKQKEGPEKGEKEQKAEAKLTVNAAPAGDNGASAAAATSGGNPATTSATAATTTNAPVDAKPPTTTPETAPAVTTTPHPADEQKPADAPAELPAPFTAEEKNPVEEEKEKPVEEDKAPDPDAEMKEDDDETEGDKEEQSDKTDKKKAGKAEKEASLAANRPRRTSKRRVQLPLSGAPPAKTTKKGSEEVVDSTNDAVRGLHLLSQAVARDKKTTARA